MRIRTKIVGPIAVLGSLLVIGCGSDSAPAVLTSSLTGNWNIVGSGSITSVPSISFSLVANGNQLYASGAFVVGCNGSSTYSGGGELLLTGTVASNGSFQLTQPSGIGLTLNGSYIQVVLSGQIPTSNLIPWSGTYSITNAAGTTGCTTNETGSFIATAYVPFKGTYAGPLNATNTIASGVSLSISPVQGSPTALQSNLLGTSYYLPVTASAMVTGIPCFSQGSTSGVPASLAAQNAIGGSSVNLRFVMSDSSELFMTGSVDGTQESALNLNFVSILGGQCAGTYYGTLLKQ